LRAALAVLPRLQRLLGATPSPLLQQLITEIVRDNDGHQHDHDLLAKAIVEAPPHYLRDGGVIAVGYDAELDELRLLGTNTEQFLLEPPCPNDQAKRP
jgi:DNA mismatch repair protein MutS